MNDIQTASEWLEQVCSGPYTTEGTEWKTGVVSVEDIEVRDRSVRRKALVDAAKAIAFPHEEVPQSEAAGWVSAGFVLHDLIAKHDAEVEDGG